MKQSKTKQKHYHPVIGVLILLVIAAIVAWFVRRPHVETGVEDAALVNHDGAVEPASKPGEDAKPIQKNRLIMSPQRPGNSVIIDEVGLQNPGYVVIHEDNNGEPGKVLGRSGLLSAGDKQDLVIRVGLAPNKSYVAVLHDDDGNKTFDVLKDLPIMSAQAAPVMVQFSPIN